MGVEGERSGILPCAQKKEKTMPVWEQMHCYTHACTCPQMWLVLWARTGSLGLRAADLHSSFLRWQSVGPKASDGNLWTSFLVPFRG